MKKKNIFILIGVILVIGITGTLAWWQWRSSINAQVFGQVCAPEMVFVGGTTINGNGLLPVRTKEEGLSKDIKVNLNNTCDNDTAVLNLNLKPDVLPEGLSDPSFKWALYKVTTEEVEGTPTETLTYINDGNFNGKRQYVNDNDLISIATDLIVTENISTYRLYIWIDGTMDNPSTIGGNSFRFKLYGTGTGAIYNQYTIANYAYSPQADLPSYFMVEDLSRDSIESIEISNISNIPSGVTSYDISSNEDGTVKLWYIENPETNLNKVYIGSDNGIVKANTSLIRTFANLTNVKKIDLTNFDTSNVTDFSGLFYKCYVLNNIDLSSFETFNVTNMRYMFGECKALSSINLSNFDTSNVTNMSYMFINCLNLTTLDLDSFNTSGVTDMSFMFDYCSNLTSVDLSSFDISNVTTFAAMFQQCSSLTSLDLSNFGVSTASNYSYMFCKCRALEKLDLSNFVTNGAQNMEAMFSGCEALTVLDINGFNTSNVTNMKYMFNICRLLHTIYVGNSWSTASVTDSSYMFSSDTSLVGGNGTVYNSSYTDMTYGRIDTATTPGYLTYKA